MGFLSKFEKEVPLTADDPAAINTAAHLDLEKQEIAQLESENQSPDSRNVYHVTPEMEKRVIGKLDKRLVPLVMFLCEFNNQGIRILFNSLHRSFGLSRSFQHWVCPTPS